VGLIVIIAMLACLAIGYWIGRICTEDFRESRYLNERSEAALAVVNRRHARSWPRGTGELAALYGKPYPE
jgi:hypothetical protein